MIQGDSCSGKRMLREDSSNRALTEGPWVPDPDEAGVTVTFEDSPQVDEGDQGDQGHENGSMLGKRMTGGFVVLERTILIFS